MSTIKELARKSFEESYLGNNKQNARRNEYGDYVLPSIQDAWSGWLAAWEDLGKDNETIQKITNGDPFVKFNEKDLKFLEIINQELEKTPHVINVADLVNPESGKTYREENSELQHNIPIGSLVEVVTGERLTVVKHTRDCDQTPLYTLGLKDNFKDYENLEEYKQCSSLFYGYSEESLKVVETK